MTDKSVERSVKVSGREGSSKNQTTMELVADREIIISRTFNGPAKIVFEAWTNADLVRRWWAPRSRGVSLASCEADVRVGGKYRYALRRDGETDAAKDIVFSGRYTEITRPTRLAYTQIFEAFPDAEMTITVTFEERDGKTHLVSREVYPSAEVRAAAIDAGMESGMRETMDQLDALVPTLG